MKLIRTGITANSKQKTGFRLTTDVFHRRGFKAPQPQNQLDGPFHSFVLLFAYQHGSSVFVTIFLDRSKHMQVIG
jgi:hypothetical protein